MSDALHLIADHLRAGRVDAFGGRAFADTIDAEATNYARAIRELEGAAFAGIRCQHGVELVDDCNDCEPLLIIPGFEPEPFLLEHDLRRGGLLL